MKVEIHTFEPWYAIILTPETLEEAAQLVRMDLNMTTKTHHQLICNLPGEEQDAGPITLRLFNGRCKNTRYVRAD